MDNVSARNQEKAGEDEGSVSEQWHRQQCHATTCSSPSSAFAPFCVHGHVAVHDTELEKTLLKPRRHPRPLKHEAAGAPPLFPLSARHRRTRRVSEIRRVRTISAQLLAPTASHHPCAPP